MSESETADGTMVKETYRLTDVTTLPALAMFNPLEVAQQFSGAIRDDHRCLSEQIRLYGYKGKR